MKAESKAVALKNTTYDIVNPNQMSAMADVLKGHIVKHRLYTSIVGKNYAHVEGWQFAGGLMGLFPIVSEVTDLSKAEEIKWMAKVEIQNIKDGKVVGRGFAVCSNKENKKKSFDEYAILSMAQTRAIGKAYRNLIGWVMKLAGYEGTPGEEMVKAGETMPAAAPVPATAAEKDAFKQKNAVKPSPAPEASCHGCGNEMTKAEAQFSARVFKKPLCRDCQGEAKRTK